MNVPIAHSKQHFDAEPPGIGLKIYLSVAWMILKVGVHALACLKGGQLSI